jgi:hypothetical protein
MTSQQGGKSLLLMQQAYQAKVMAQQPKPTSEQKQEDPPPVQESSSSVLPPARGGKSASQLLAFQAKVSSQQQDSQPALSQEQQPPTTKPIMEAPTDKDKITEERIMASRLSSDVLGTQISKLRGAIRQCNQCVSDGLDRFPWGKKRSTQELSLSQRPKQKRGKVKNANDSGKTCSDAEMSEAENRGEESEIKIIETRLTEKQHVSENPGNDRSCCCGDICFVGENTRTMAITVRCSVCHFYCHEECSVSNPSGEDSGDEAYMQIMCDLCSKKTKCSAV